MALKTGSRKDLTIKRPEKGKPLDLKMEDLKAVLGDHLEVACLNPNVIPGTGGSIMVPKNEPCPVNPHNHDGSLKAKFFQKVFIVKPQIAKKG